MLLDRNQGKDDTSPILWVLVLILIVLIGLMLVYRPSIVKGDSMLPNVHNEDIVMVESRTIRLNNMVIAQTDSKRLIKRVIGLPGDEIEFRKKDGNPNYAALYRNGVLIDEDGYIYEDMLAIKFSGYEKAKLNTPIVLGEGEYFLMGDNRNNSHDSRQIGAVKKSQIEGVVAAVFKSDSFMARLIRTFYRTPSLDENDANNTIM